MKRVFNKLKGSRRSFLLATVVLIFLVFIVVPGFFFGQESGIPFYSSIIDNYLILIKKSANLILNLSGSEVIIGSDNIKIADGSLSTFIPQIYFKKWVLLFLAFVWITKTHWRNKAIFSMILLLTHFFVNSVYVALNALIIYKEVSLTLVTIPLTIGISLLFTIIIIWYKRFKDVLLQKLSRIRLNQTLFRDPGKFAITGYGFILVYYLLYDIFDYHIWINILFTSSKIILGLFGYSATVEPFYLHGDNGSIFMLKSCLGYQTMFLFAVFILLTGNTSNRIRWIYILSGFLFLNIVNIVRFVLLFIHVQKHGDYVLTMNLHDMYNYIIYAIVFVLWIIWFEKFADQPGT